MSVLRDSRLRGVYDARGREGLDELSDNDDEVEAPEGDLSDEEDSNARAGDGSASAKRNVADADTPNGLEAFLQPAVNRPTYQLPKDA